MCIVSMVTTGIQEQYPPLKQWPYQQVVDMSEVLKKLDALDKKLGNKECYEPVKDKFLQELAERLEHLEEQVSGLNDNFQTRLENLEAV